MASQDVESVYARERSASQYPWSKRNLLQSTESSNDCQVLCLHSEEVGYYILQHNVDVTELLNLVVFSAHQGRGFGKQAFTFIFNEAVRKQNKEVWLEVRESNAIALKLYKSLGFIEQGVRKNYYPIEPESTLNAKENAILMACAVGQELKCSIK